MKDRFSYRCPCCGAWYTHTKNAITNQIRKAKKGEIFIANGELKELPMERPVFDLIDPDRDPMVIWRRGRAVLGKFTWTEAYLNLPPSELGFFKRKIEEIYNQAFKILKCLHKFRGLSNVDDT